MKKKIIQVFKTHRMSNTGFKCKPNQGLCLQALLPFTLVTTSNCRVSEPGALQGRRRKRRSGWSSLGSRCPIQHMLRVTEQQSSYVLFTLLQAPSNLQWIQPQIHTVLHCMQFQELGRADLSCFERNSLTRCYFQCLPIVIAI